jgi:hypothetical protein
MALGGVAMGLWISGLPARLGGPGAASGTIPAAAWLLIPLALALGGLWWGETIGEDPDLARPLFSAAALLGAAADWAAVHLPLPGAASPLGASLWLVPALFFWSAAPPALTAMAFPDRRGQSRGVFAASALALACAALGLTLAPPPGLGPAAWAELAAVAAALAAWPWAGALQAAGTLRLWPGYSLGMWRGDVHGHDLGVSLRLTRTVVPAACLGAAAAGMALAPLWRDGGVQGPDPAVLADALALAALGALVLGPALAGLTSPATSLALVLAVLAAGLLRSALPDGPALASLAALERPPGLAARLLDGLPLAALGGLWPLTARIELAKSPVIPGTVARLDFFLLASLLAGAAASLFLGALAAHGAGGPVLWPWPVLAAWTAAVLALAPSLGWPPAIGLWVLVAGLARWRWW